VDKIYETNMTNTINTGKIGEQAAANFLKSKGYAILEMNFQNTWGRRKGEIDIIAKKDGELVFVEVKTREFWKYKDTLPEENITRSKLSKLARIADEYLLRNNLRGANYRFDAVSVWLDYNSKMAKIKHIENIYL